MPRISAVTPEQKRETLAALQKHGSQSAAADALGLKRTTFQSRLLIAQADINLTPTVEFPAFVDGDEDEPIEDIHNRLRKGFERKEKAAQARHWFPIKVKEAKPYGVLWFGDPHLTSGNFPLLERHLAVARQDGVYGANIGDTTDNWAWTGRLAKVWSETDTSSKTEKRLAEWFMFEAGVSWLVWLLGNHDAWNGNADFYKRLGVSHVPVIDWRAQFKLSHANGSETKIDAAHGRKGTSIYNPTHGMVRDAKFGGDCDLFVTGHTHNFGIFEIDLPEKSRASWLIQVAGYKIHDDYAWTNGFSPATKGASALVIVDPQSGKVSHCFSDVEEGGEYLKWLRR